MSRDGDILAVERKVVDDITITEVRVDMGGGDIVEAEHVSDPGDDSHPIPGRDVATVTDSPGAGNKQTSGYFDPLNPPQTAPGEKRIYGRDSETGLVVNEFWLKNTGEIAITILNGAALTITSDGPVVVDSPDVRVGSGAGRKIALVGDIVQGTLHALSTAPGNPLAPNLVPVPGAGISFAAKITGPGSTSGKA
jgi:hypothetical protein